MPTTPPRKASQRATSPRAHGPSGKTSGRGKGRKPWWSSPWIPLGHLVAGLALALGFHVTFRLWDQTRTYEPLDLSPPFAAKPLPGTSLDSLMRRYGNQLSPLLNPSPLPDRPTPPPPVPTPDVTANGTTPAVVQPIPERRDDAPAQNQPTLAAPRLPPPAPPAPGESTTPGLAVPPPPPSFGVPQLPSPPAAP